MRWSERHVGNVKEQILIANEVILQLDRKADMRRLTDDWHGDVRGIIREDDR
jgi:hypothetical protein